MSSSRKKSAHLILVLFTLFSSLIAIGLAYTGGRVQDPFDDAANASERINENLYKEVPPIEIQGNMTLRDNPDDPNDIPYFETRFFNPRTPTVSELYDSDQDGVDDTPINHFRSFGNAANRLLDIELAACVKPPPDKHLGYKNKMVWTEPWVEIPGTDKYRYQFPDKMPAKADMTGTNGTQFLQLILPFEVDGSGLFNSNPALDYLDPEFLTIEDEAGNHVFCTVLVNGKDAKGNGPDLYQQDPEWPQLAGVDLMKSIVFIAQPKAGVLGDVPDHEAFSAWAARNEIHIHLKKAYDEQGNLLELDSKWFVLKGDGTPEEPVVMGIEVTHPVKDETGNVVVDPDSPPGEDILLIHRDTNFIIHFSKPVVPETVGQSIVFGGEPFNGNMGPLPSSLAWNPPPPGKNPCANGGTYFDPIATNVAVVARVFYPDGTPQNVEAVVPFRCHPQHQNNLCTYVLNPLVDLPSSSDLGQPYFSNPEISRMRITVSVFYHDQNIINWSPYKPVNLGACGYFMETMKEENFSSTFTVNSDGRYVNAPVCPQALCYAMGSDGLGVVDLDGNGFTTNDPVFSKAELVTSQPFYNKFGNSAMGIGNDYSYGYKATGGAPYVGLGVATAMPGVNEGSTGIDEVVRDSNGCAMLYPGPEEIEKPFEISDVEIGDFLDTLFFDGGNVWAHDAFHESIITGILGVKSNLIGTPPTPNPPPMTLPIGMNAIEVVRDEWNFNDEGAFVVMGKEVFTVNILSLGMPMAIRTGFVHLDWAAHAGSPHDVPFPPNPWPGKKLYEDYVHLGPMAESSTLGFGTPFGSRQQIGNFLFAADKADNAVRVLNSNSMEVITSLTGFSEPDSLAVTSDLKKLYVSNFGGRFVDVFNVDPSSDEFTEKIGRIWVGDRPKGICCQPDGEDVFVCNFKGNSISIIDQSTNTVRKTLTSYLYRPWDMVAGPRQTSFGFQTGVFHGYVSNYGGDNVLIYESGPDGVGGIGYDDILGAVRVNVNKFQPIESPRGLCWDPLHNHQNYLAGGCFVAHESGGNAVVSRIQFTHQKAPLGPIFIPPGSKPGFLRRVFQVTEQWGGPTNPLSGTAAADVALLDYNRYAWEKENWGGNLYVTNLGDIGNNPIKGLPVNNKHPIRILSSGAVPTVMPDRMYISFTDVPVIDVADPSSPQLIKTITGLSGNARVLKTYFKF